MAERMEELIKSKEMHQKERLALKATQLHMKEVEQVRAFKLQEQQLKHQADALRFFQSQLLRNNVGFFKNNEQSISSEE